MKPYASDADNEEDICIGIEDELTIHNIYQASLYTFATLERGLTMKKATVLLLALLLCICAFGCGQASQHDPSDTSKPDAPVLNSSGGTGENNGAASSDTGNSGNGATSGTNGADNTQMSGNNNALGSDSLQAGDNNANNGTSSSGNAAKDDIKPETCSYCQQTGHKEEDCSAKKADETPCSYCKKTGHKLDACPTKAEDAAPCSYCKQTGHKADSCPIKAADEAPCSYCGAADHKVADCKQKKADEFDVGYWVQYAKDYAVSIGLTLDPTMSKETSCWDNPIVAKYSSKYLERNIQSRMNEYKRYVEVYGIAGIVWVEALPDGPYEWDLMVYYA